MKNLRLCKFQIKEGKWENGYFHKFFLQEEKFLKAIVEDTEGKIQRVDAIDGYKFQFIDKQCNTLPIAKFIGKNCEIEVCSNNSKKYTGILKKYIEDHKTCSITIGDNSFGYSLEWPVQIIINEIK